MKPPAILGISLIELLCCLVIIGLLAHTPSWIKSGLMRYERRHFLNQLEEALDYARSEALKRNTTISLCPISSLNTCGKNWSKGIMVFVNTHLLSHPKTSAEVLLQIQALRYGKLFAHFSFGLNKSHLININAQGKFMNLGQFSYCPFSLKTKEADGLVVSRFRVRRLYNRNKQGVLLTEINGPLTNPLICY